MICGYGQDQQQYYYWLKEINYRNQAVGGKCQRHGCLEIVLFKDIYSTLPASLEGQDNSAIAQEIQTLRAETDPRRIIIYYCRIILTEYTPVNDVLKGHCHEKCVLVRPSNIYNRPKLVDTKLFHIFDLSFDSLQCFFSFFTRNKNIREIELQ
jgi:hypothetical protein